MNTKKNTTAPESKEPAINVLAIEADMKSLSTVADLEKDEVLAAGIDLGRLEAMDFVLTISTSAIVSIFENIKKSKGWRHLKNPKNADGQHFQSLDEFCQVKMCKSYARLRELSSNRKAIGQDAFEQAERLGLRQVDYNAIKSLPAPDQELIRRAVEESTTKDEVLSVLQELAAKHGREKTELEAKLLDEREERKSTEDLLGDRDATIKKLKRAQERIATETPDQALSVVLQELAARANNTLGQVRGNLRLGFQAVSDLETPDHGNSHRGVMRGYLDDIQRELDILRADFFLFDHSASKASAD